MKISLKYQKLWKIPNFHKEARFMKNLSKKPVYKFMEKFQKTSKFSVFFLVEFSDC